MKKLFSILLVIITITFSFSQQNEDDINALSIFNEYSKAKNYEAAYGPWSELRNRNPKFHLGIYSEGEKILKYKIKNSLGNEKISFIQDLIFLYSQRRDFFQSKTPLGKFLAKSAKLQYDHRKLLNISNLDLFNSYDNAFKSDLKSFNNPVDLLTYFKLAVELFDDGIKSAEELFTKYDEVSEKVESEVENYTIKLNAFLPTDDSAELTYSKKDAQKIRAYNSYLKGYEQISKGMDISLGILSLIHI